MEENQVKFKATNDSSEKKPSRTLTHFRTGSLLYKLRKHFKSYCNHTSIHGFQYFGQNRTVIEKFWWIIIFMCIISGCGFGIYLIYNKWRQSPVIVSLTTKDTPIYQVPFPAVTICPTIKFARGAINFGDIFQKLTDIEIYDDNGTTLSDEELELFQYMLPVCKPGQLWIFEDIFDTNDSVSDQIYEKFLNNSPYLRGQYNFVNFMEKEQNFLKEFRPLLTEEGLCFTFNMLSTKDLYTEKTFLHKGFKSDGPESTWVPQHGFSNEADIYTYPRRALQSGALYSLDMKLFHLKEDIDYKCTGAQQGYKVILHLPTRVPRPTLEFMMAPFGKASSISVSPDMMTTSDVVKNYDPEQRDCYFPGEKNLQFFKIYSKTNCAFECLTNFTLNECGCVSFEMPRQADTPICGVSKLHCVTMARKKYNLSRLRSKLDQDMERANMKKAPRRRPKNQSSPKSIIRSKREDSPLDEDLNEDNTRCYCLRSCFDITYKGKSSVMDYNWRSEILFNVLDNISSPEFDFTQISIYLDTNTVFTKEVNELYGPTDFLSNFGGLLGLFTGFSILSFMEIIYFCTLRIFGNQRLIGRWYGDIDDK